MRSIWTTKTVKAARFSTVAGLVMLIGPQAISLAERSVKTADAKANIRDIGSIVLSIAGACAAGGGVGSILGRAAADGPVTSPSWMPGPNAPKREDI